MPKYFVRHSVAFQARVLVGGEIVELTREEAAEIEHAVEEIGNQKSEVRSQKAEESKVESLKPKADPAAQPSIANRQSAIGNPARRRRG